MSRVTMPLKVGHVRGAGALHSGQSTDGQKADQPGDALGEEVDQLRNEVFVGCTFKHAVGDQDVAAQTLKDGEREEG